MDIVGAIDTSGRCQHWRSEADVVTNRCATCGKWFACYLCHPADHPFGPAPLADAAASCGACGHAMSYASYRAAMSGERPGCPACGQKFNPGCMAHAGIYWEV